MAQVSRHAGAPFVNGETANATDVETDISGIVAQLNGNIDATNIAAGANIPGSALAADSVPGSKLQDDSVTIDKLADDSVGTDQLVDNAATQDASAESVATVALTSSFIDLASAAITTHASTRSVLVIARFHVANAGVGALSTLTVQLLRGASNLNNGGGALASETISIPAGAGAGKVVNLIWIDKVPTAGASLTYKVQAHHGGGFEGMNVKNRQIIALELRR